MIEIVEIDIQVVAQSKDARKDAIKMLARLLAELRRSDIDETINLQTDRISEGHVQIQRG